MTVTTQRARAAARRAGPRLVRLADRGARNSIGVVVALILAARLWGQPVLLSALASPRWSALAAYLGAVTRGRGATLGGLALLALAWLTAGWVIAWFLAVPGFAWAAARVAVAIYPHTTRGRVRSRYGVDGFLSYWEWRRFLSAHTVRQAAVTNRPSIGAELPVVDPAAPAGQAAGQHARRLHAIEHLPVTSCGTWLGVTAVGPFIGLSCFATLRDTVGIIGAPGCGKTGLLASQLIDHDGPAVATSTKPDLLAVTGALRARRARSGRIEIFDPEGLTEGGSTFRWDPILGCDRPGTAAERAAAFVGASSSAGGDDGRFWADAAARVLRALLMAAALDGRSMRDVYAWATSTAKADDALALLEGDHRDRAPFGWATDLRQQLHTDAKKTRDSTWATLAGAVAWMADPLVAETVCPGPDEPVFDTAAFLADNGSLYLLGSEREHSTVAPLLAVLTTAIFEESKLIAARMPGGRLDPPLGLFLDECALVVPVPLHKWIADAAGRGIPVVWAAQSLSQLVERWGRTGAETIFNSTNAKIVYGGLSLTSDVETVSSLCGTRHELVADPDGTGPGRMRFERVPVIPPERVRTVPPWHAVLLHRSAPATVVRIAPAWERADVKKAGPPPAIRPIRDVVADKTEHDPATGPIPVQVGTAA